ncbi:MAG: response regulator transcription factor [Oxalobacteraceae bacterium]
MRIALLDHDPQQRKTLESLLNTSGYQAAGFSRPDALRMHLQSEEPDLLIIDWPEDSGRLPLLISLREQWPELPLLLLCGRAPDAAVSAELATHRADVLLKPIRKTELLLRLQLLMDRYRPGQSRGKVMSFGRYEFLPGRSTVEVEGRSITLTQKEFELALLFFRHLGRPLSRAYIHETVWSRDAELSSRTLDTHVSRVRNKLGLKPESGYRLAPVYSFGYRLEQIPE